LLFVNFVAFISAVLRSYKSWGNNNILW